MRVYVSTCAWRTVEMLTAQALFRLTWQQEPRFSWGARINDALIDRARSLEATSFLDNPDLGEVLLFIDSDIWFSSEDAVKVVEHAAAIKGICGGAYMVRSLTDQRLALSLFPDQAITFGPGEAPVLVRYLSTGFLAVHRLVFEALAADLPRCQSGTHKMHPFFLPMVADGMYLSEDWAFCRRAREAGFGIWLHQGVSLHHLGFKSFTLNDLRHKDGVVQGTFTEGVKNGG